MGCVGSKKAKAEHHVARPGGANVPVGRPMSRQDYYNRHSGIHNKPRLDDEPPKLPDQAGRSA